MQSKFAGRLRGGHVPAFVKANPRESRRGAVPQGHDDKKKHPPETQEEVVQSMKYSNTSYLCGDC